MPHTISDYLYLELIANCDWEELSEHVPIQEVRDNPHLPWDRKGLSYNSGTGLDTLTLELPNASKEYDWYYLTEQTPMRDIRIIPDGYWCLELMSSKEDIRASDLTMDLPNATGKWDIDDLLSTLTAEEIRDSLPPPWPWDLRPMNNALYLSQV